MKGRDLNKISEKIDSEFSTTRFSSSSKDKTPVYQTMGSHYTPISSGPGVYMGPAPQSMDGCCGPSNTCSCTTCDCLCRTCSDCCNNIRACDFAAACIRECLPICGQCLLGTCQCIGQVLR